jgi:RND superfamily putative drug exporter
VGTFARWCLHHRKLVVLGWIAALVTLVAVASGVGSAYTQDFRLPDTESTRALDLLEQTFPTQSGETDRIVFHVDDGTVRDPAIREQTTAMLDRVRQVDTVVDVTGPYDEAGAGQISRDGQTAFANVTFDQINPDKDAVRRLIDVAESARTDQLQVELGASMRRSASWSPRSCCSSPSARCSRCCCP